MTSEENAKAFPIRSWDSAERRFPHFAQAQQRQLTLKLLRQNPELNLNTLLLMSSDRFVTHVPERTKLPGP